MIQQFVVSGWQWSKTIVDTWWETASREIFFVENGVHFCCYTFFRWYLDEIPRLATRQSSFNIDASKTPRLRFFWKCGLWLENSGVQPESLKRWSGGVFVGNRIEKGERPPRHACGRILRRCALREMLNSSIIVPSPERSMSWRSPHPVTPTTTPAPFPTNFPILHGRSIILSQELYFSSSSRMKQQRGWYYRLAFKSLVFVDFCSARSTDNIGDPNPVSSISSVGLVSSWMTVMIVGALVTWAIYTQGQLLLWSSLITTGVVPGYK